MYFNEQNTEEHFIFLHFTGVNLNAFQGNIAKEEAVKTKVVQNGNILIPIYYKGTLPKIL